MIVSVGLRLEPRTQRMGDQTGVEDGALIFLRTYLAAPYFLRTYPAVP